MLVGRSDVIPEIELNDHEICFFSFGMHPKNARGVIAWQYENANSWTVKGLWMDNDWRFSA